MKINKLLVGTHNPGKLTEIKKQLSSLNIEIFSLTDLGIKEDYQETGATFEENAVGKAKFYHQLSGLPTLADDAGLEIDALGGEPGVMSRRWPGYEASDQELLDLLFTKLKGVPMEKRGAKFVAISALTDGQELIVSRGECLGRIGTELACEIKPGIPWSSVFYPTGYKQVFSQLSVEEKNKISHRGRSLNNLIKELEKK
ncbi:non-canonical purine NTP pyrophosphatase [Candidatus Parcubacteria bacterium]|nr:MAG: non-canonical purine NTP pyrophosphatase [Candidatus Parcubacteria bacterium]